MFVLQRFFIGAIPLWMLASLVLFLLPNIGAAQDPLRCEMKTISEKLRDLFAGRRIKEVAVGEVSNADPTMPSSSGAGIRELLIEELKRTEIMVKLRTEVGLSVSFRGRKIPDEKDRKIELLIVEMRFTLTLNDSQEDLFTHRVKNDEANRHILGLSIHNTGKGKDRFQQTILAFSKPMANFDGPVILAGEKAPYGVEILVDGKPVNPSDEDGFGLVKLSRDQTYAVRLVNRSSIEVAARLSVDGLNIFTFSELRRKDGPYKGCPLYDMVLIAPMQSVTIPGWHFNNSISHKFKITHYAETAAAKVNKSTDIGTITATFCAAWEKTPPTDEPDGARDPKADGTGFGEPTMQK